MTQSYSEIIKNGLWNNNPGLVQLLGLCPLLAVTATFINGLGLGLATTFVLIGSNLSVSMIRKIVRPQVRIPVFVIIIASLVTAVELTMNAFFHDLYRVLGIFIPLIVTNCAIIGRAEAFASKHSPPRALLDGLMMGMGFTLVLVTLGGMREIIGRGTLFAHAHMMFGEAARGLEFQPFGEAYSGFLLAVLPPGAFIGLGLLIALKNAIDARLDERKVQSIAESEPVKAGA